MSFDDLIRERLHELRWSGGGNERDALRDVLDLHTLVNENPFICTECEGARWHYPCPTVQAIPDALGVVTDE